MATHSTQLSDHMEAEKLRILRAVRDGRMVTNEHGRWVIHGERRPDRKAREALFNSERVDYTFIGPSRVTAYKLTEAGERDLVAAEGSG